MKVEMLMPQMGESIAEATILTWHKDVGDAVKKDETILEISTDKVDSEIPAPESGVIVEILAHKGDTVEVKSVIAIIESKPGGGAAAAAAKDAAVQAKRKAPQKPAEKKAPRKPASSPAIPPGAAPPPGAAALLAAMQAAGAAASALPTHYGENFYSPLVRSISAQHGVSAVELASIPGSGQHGRVTRDDVMEYLKHRGTPAGALPAQGNGASTSSSAHMPPPQPRPEYGSDGTRVEKMDNMRQRIAEHMVRSKATSPHVYSTSEVDVSSIACWRQEHQATFQSQEGFKLSFTPFFLEAAVKALIQFPYVNASVEGDEIILKRDINLGCAVALGTTGLIVPVIKNADQLSFVELARALTDLAGRARSKQLLPDDVQGGTFTVTNPGVFGNTAGYPIINQPQLAILSIGAIKKRPVVVHDMIAVREMVCLTLSHDHRLVDGSLGGQFLQYISEYLERWDMSRVVN